MRYAYLLSLLLLLTASTAGWTSTVAAPQTHPSTFETFHANVAVFRVVNDHHTPAADAFFTTIAPSYAYWILPAFIVIILIVRRDRRIFWAALIAVVIQAIIVHSMKAAFHQPRPLAVLDGVHSFKGLMLYSKSFPSADAALVFTIAASLRGFAKKPVQVVLYIYGVLIAYERIYVGAHFPLDVTVGAVVGMISGWAGSRIILRRSRDQQPDKQEVAR